MPQNSIVSPVSGIVSNISEEEDHYFINITTYPLLHCQVMAFCTEGAALDTANNTVNYKNNIIVKHCPVFYGLYGHFLHSVDEGIYGIALFGFRTILKIPKKFIVSIVPGQKLIDRETIIAIIANRTKEQ